MPVKKGTEKNVDNLRDKKDAIDNPALSFTNIMTNIEKNVQQTEKVDHLMRLNKGLNVEVTEKTFTVNEYKKEVNYLKSEIDRKDKVLKEKDIIIKGIVKQVEDDNVWTNTIESADDYKDTVNDLKLGEGRFGKELEVREGMEEEAEALRKEWRSSK